MKYDSDAEVSVYKLVDPEDENQEPKYIGITTQSLRSRLTRHCGKDETMAKTHKANWINLLVSAGRRPKIILIEKIIGWKNACDREIYWIQFYKSLGIKLCNVTLGGDGTLGNKLSEKHKLAISNAQSGKTVSNETREKLSILFSGENHPGFGKALPEETKAKMRKPKTTEAIKNISAAKLGNKNPMFGKVGELAGHYGKKHSEETRLKIREARKRQIIIISNITCPHCGKNGASNAMRRWHFNNCKFKE